MQGITTGMLGRSDLCRGAERGRGRCVLLFPVALCVVLRLLLFLLLLLLLLVLCFLEVTVEFAVFGRKEWDRTLPRADAAEFRFLLRCCDTYFVLTRN